MTQDQEIDLYSSHERPPIPSYAELEEKLAVAVAARDELQKKYDEALKDFRSEQRVTDA